MTIMYFQVTPISRGRGRSAVAAAAYRSGERLRDERTGKLHNYAKRDDVPHKEIFLPDGLNAERISWVKDRAQLWNAAERAEHQRNSRTAREFLVALPHELPAEQRTQLARTFSQEVSDRYRVVVDLAVHLPRPKGDARNFHAHLMLSSREITPNGFGGKAGLDLQSGQMQQRGLREGIAEIKYMRERWATLANDALRNANLDVRVDHRTLAAQGVDRLPKARVPWSTVERERRGLTSEIGDRIRANHLARTLAKRQRALALDQASGQEAANPGLGSTPETGSASRASQAQPQPQTDRSLKPSVADLQREARDAWLKMRQAVANSGPQTSPQARTADRANEHSTKPQSRDDDLSL